MLKNTSWEIMDQLIFFTIYYYFYAININIHSLIKHSFIINFILKIQLYFYKENLRKYILI